MSQRLARLARMLRDGLIAASPIRDFVAARERATGPILASHAAAKAHAQQEPVVVGAEAGELDLLLEAAVPADAPAGSEMRVRWDGSANPKAKVLLYVLDPEAGEGGDVDGRAFAQGADDTPLLLGDAALADPRNLFEREADTLRDRLRPSAGGSRPFPAGGDRRRGGRLRGGALGAGRAAPGRADDRRLPERAAGPTSWAQPASLVRPGRAGWRAAGCGTSGTGALRGRHRAQRRRACVDARRSTSGPKKRPSRSNEDPAGTSTDTRGAVLIDAERRRSPREQTFEEGRRLPARCAPPTAPGTRSPPAPASSSTTRPR